MEKRLFDERERFNAMLPFSSSNKSNLPRNEPQSSIMVDLKKSNRDTCLGISTGEDSRSLIHGLGPKAYGHTIRWGWDGDFSQPQELCIDFAGNSNVDEKNGCALMNCGMNGIGNLGIGSKLGEQMPNTCILQTEQVGTLNRNHGGNQGFSIQTKCKKVTPKKRRKKTQDVDWLSEHRSPSYTSLTNPLESSSGGGTHLSQSGTQNSPMAEKHQEIQHSLKDSMKSAGWTIFLRPHNDYGYGDSIYVSPSGSTYGSLPKAWDAFLRESSKQKEKEWGFSHLEHKSGSNNGSKLSVPARMVRSIQRKELDKDYRFAPPTQLHQEGPNNNSTISAVAQTSSSLYEMGLNKDYKLSVPAQLPSKALNKDHKLLAPAQLLQEGISKDCKFSAPAQLLEGFNKDATVFTPALVSHLVHKDGLDNDCKFLPSAQVGLGKHSTFLAPTKNSQSVHKEGLNKNPIFLAPADMPHLMPRPALNMDCIYLSPTWGGRFDPSRQDIGKGMKKWNEGLGKRKVAMAGLVEPTTRMEDPPPLEPRLENDKGRELLLTFYEVDPRKTGDVISCMTDEKKILCSHDKSMDYGTEKSECRGLMITNIDSFLESACKTMAVGNVQNGDSGKHQGGNKVAVRRTVRAESKLALSGQVVEKMGVQIDGLHSTKCVIEEAADMDREKPSNLTPKIEKMESGVSLSGNKLLKQKVGNKSDSQKPEDQMKAEGNNIYSRCKTSLKKNSRTKIPSSEKLSPSKRKSATTVNSNRKKKKNRSGGCGLYVRRTMKDDNQEKLSPETKSILSRLIDAGTLVENEKVLYKIKTCKGRFLRGWVTREGIRCNCCKKVVPLVEFEAHSGSNLNQPWSNTCLVSGKSLLQCQSEAWALEKKNRNVGFQIVGVNDVDKSDDSCGICADGGNLICCDNCPSTFHLDCLLLKDLPEGIWYCPYCKCAFCMMAMHKQDQTDEAASLLTCGQCERKYHMECICEHDTYRELALKSLLFCGQNCKKVAAGLADMLGVSNSIGGGFSWTLLKRLDENEHSNSDQMLCFIMECNSKLSVALSVMDECFVPLVDPKTGLDMIAQAVYNCGSNFSRLNCQGFYTVVLEKGEEIISVASLRIHGTHLAEMPFIGTRPMYRRQGMCRRLLNAIEDMLRSLYVEKLIIPAIPDLLETWMTSFSFKPLELSHKKEIRNLNMMAFAETTLLQKPIYSILAKDVSGDKKHVGELSSLGGWVQTTCELQNFADSEVVPRWWSSNSSTSGYKDPSLASCNDSNIVNGYASDLSCAQSLFQKLDMVIGDTSVELNNVSLPSSHVPRWLQNVNKEKDSLLSIQS